MQFVMDSSKEEKIKLSMNDNPQSPLEEGELVDNINENNDNIAVKENLQISSDNNDISNFIVVKQEKLDPEVDNSLHNIPNRVELQNNNMDAKQLNMETSKLNDEIGNTNTEEYIPTIKTELTDEEIMHHLDEIENIVLHSPSFILQDHFESDIAMNLALDEDIDVKPDMLNSEENLTNLIEDNKKEETRIMENNKQNEHSVIKVKKTEELKDDAKHNSKNDSNKSKKKSNTTDYMEKLKGKENVVKDRLERLSRVLEYSYPSYKKWLTKIVFNKGTAFCQLDKSVHSSLKENHTNRWKFSCQKILDEDNNKTNDSEVDNVDKDNEVEKKMKVTWKVRPMNKSPLNISSNSFPPYIMNIAQDFEEFLINDPTIHKETKINKNVKPDERKEFTNLTLRANYKNEIMIIVVGFNITHAMIETLKKFFKGGGGNYKNLKSVYCKSFFTHCTSKKNYSSVTFLCGSEVLEDKIGNLRIQLAPRTNFWSNIRGVEMISSVIDEYLPQWPNTTLLEIGCGIGLITLLMSHKFDNVIGMDAESEIDEAKKICRLNNIHNAVFMKDDSQSVQKLFNDLAKHQRIVGIVNHNAVCGRSIELITNLRKLSSLKRLVLIVTFTKQSIRSILELMQPTNDILGNPFFPVRCCLIDTVPDGSHFELAMLMERRFMKKITATKDVEVISPPKTNSDYKRAINPMFNASEIDLRNQIEQKRSLAEKEMQNKRKNLGPSGSNRNYNRNNTETAEVDEVLENVKQQQAILEKAAKKLKFSSSSLDPNTARQLKSMLHIVLEQTNEIQNKLPRIAQPHDETRKSEAIKNMDLPILVPGKSKKYQNIAPLEPNTFCVKRSRGGSGFSHGNRGGVFNQNNRGSISRRPVKERLNGYIENGSPPREITESLDWDNPNNCEQQSEPLRKRKISPVRFPDSSPQRYESRQQSRLVSPRLQREQYEPHRYDNRPRERYRGSSPQKYKNYRSTSHLQDHHERSPQRRRIVYSPSLSRYSRSRSPRQSVSPYRRISRSRSPIQYRHRVLREDVHTSPSPPRRYRRVASPEVRRRYRSPSPKVYYRENEYQNEENWRRSSQRQIDSRFDGNSQESYTAYEREHNRRPRIRSRNHESEWNDIEMSDDESRYVKSKNVSYVDLISIPSRSPSPHDSWGSSKREPSTSRSFRAASEKAPELKLKSRSRSDKSLRDPRIRTANVAMRDTNVDELPDDAKDPWSEDNSIVMNPVTLSSEEMTSNQNRYNWSMFNQWPQSGNHTDQWIPTQRPSTSMPHTSSWGAHLTQAPMMESNPNLGQVSNIYHTANMGHRSNVAQPDSMMMQSQMCLPGMVSQMCPTPVQMQPLNGMQQNWNQNVGSRPQSIGPRTNRNPDPYHWNNENYRNNKTRSQIN